MTKFSSQFGFLEDDEIFFHQIAERAKRNKAKTEYVRRESNVSDQKTEPLESTPNRVLSSSKDKDVITE